MFGKWLTTAVGSISREFLFAGLFPALWALIPSLVVTVGISETLEFLKDGANLKNISQGLVVSIALWFLFATILFSLRERNLDDIAQLRGAVFRWIRQPLLRRQREKHRQLVNARDSAYYRYTVADWPNRKFESANVVPPIFAAKYSSARVVKNTSQYGRKKLEMLARVNDASLLSTDRETILEGLIALHTASAKNKLRSTVAAELVHWKTLANKAASRALLDQLPNLQKHEISVTHNALRRMPQQQWVQPTALGNVYARIDDYGEMRYGMPTRMLWSRLRLIIDDKLCAPVDKSRQLATAYINQSFGFAMGGSYAFFVGAAETIHSMVGSTSELSLRGICVGFICFGFSTLLARAFYLSAVTAVETGESHVESVIDLKRRELLDALGINAGTWKDEATLFQALQEYWVTGALSPRLGDTDYSKPPA